MEQEVRRHGEISFLKIDALPKDAVPRGSNLVKKSEQNDAHNHIVENGEVYVRHNVKFGEHTFSEVVYIVSKGNAVIKMQNAADRHGPGSFPEGVYEGLTVLETDHASKVIAELVD